MIRVTDFKSGDKDDDSDGTLFQSDVKALSACRMAYVFTTSVPFTYKANWKRYIGSHVISFRGV